MSKPSTWASAPEGLLLKQALQRSNLSGSFRLQSARLLQSLLLRGPGGGLLLRLLPLGLQDLDVFDALNGFGWLRDLRDSGDVEQDADNILFLYREEYYLRLTEPDMANAKAYDAWNTRMEMSRGKIEFIAAKSRHGETGRRNGYFFGANQAVRGSDFYTSGRIL